VAVTGRIGWSCRKRLNETVGTTMLSGIRYYRKVLGWRGVRASALARASRSIRYISVQPAGVKAPITLRVPSTDVSTYGQVFLDKEYDFRAIERPRVIVDAGANIGLASIVFANRYPEAKIFAIEPERDNFSLLADNVRPYDNIVPLQAALWGENTTINMVDPGAGAWGFMTEPAGEGHATPAITVDRLMRDHGIDHVDVLKVDIEGAEKEVFADTAAWIDRVDSIIVELHERLKAGCNRSFYNATSGFSHEWLQGENVYVSRPGVLGPAGHR
jgi:FkbM family methyltransferase